MLQQIIHKKKEIWLSNPENPVLSILAYIKQKGKLRKPQIEAIETYLFLKIAGQNKALPQLLAEGFFLQGENLDNIAMTQNVRELLQTNTAARAIFELRTYFPELKKMVLEHSHEIDFEELIKKMFYNVSYTDYLFSLPMGAGKTFLMATFIYLDLYFALLEPQNPVFAHNFIIMAPSGLKSSIVPSLKTIQNFDATWVLPPNNVKQIQHILQFETLDQSKSGAKSNKARNPNASKVSNKQPFDVLIGLVLIVNAEKVILDKVSANKNPTLIEETQDEKEKKANELRHLIGQIPNLAILIDEVHHAATDDIKLRQVVSAWHEKGSITTIMGFSGTPYLPSAKKEKITEDITIKHTQIANVVYYYPLIKAVTSFLKQPDVVIEKGANLQPLEIIKSGTTKFLHQFGNTIYKDGTTAKLAIYCSNIERLETEIYPFLINDLKVPAEQILKYHQGNANYKIDKNSQTQFMNLDSPSSKIKVVLLVQIGKEGWDCRSLTGVILSQKGDCPTNMVLQTACRCLRQQDYPENISPPVKTALICLNEDNAASLDKQLKETQHSSLAELSDAKNETAPVLRERVNRGTHLQLPKIELYQLQVSFETTFQETSPNTVEKLKALEEVQPQAVEQIARELDVNAHKSRTYLTESKGEKACFDYWLLHISKESFGAVAMPQLYEHQAFLFTIFEKISIVENENRYFNIRYPLLEIESIIRRAFALKRELHTREEIIRKEVELLIVENLKPIAPSDKLVPNEDAVKRILAADNTKQSVESVLSIQNQILEQMRETLVAQGLGAMAENIVLQRANTWELQKDKTFHIIPYRFDSLFEKNILENILQDADFQNLNLEVYFSGEDNLSNFYIDCFAKNTDTKWQRTKRYFPDFLILQRKENGEIHRLLILETKGEGFALNFQKTKHFVESQFIPQNNEKFGYQKFDFLYLQDDDNQRLQKLNQKIKTFFT